MRIQALNSELNFEELFTWSQSRLGADSSRSEETESVS